MVMVMIMVVVYEKGEVLGKEGRKVGGGDLRHGPEMIVFVV